MRFIEQLAKVDTIVFDKTGTITTTNKKSKISYEGTVLSDENLLLVKKCTSRPIIQQNVIRLFAQSNFAK
jgi:cation transport ATPase